MLIAHAALNGEFRPHYRLQTFFPEAEGLSAGAAVRLDGVEVGRVERIALATANSADTSVPHIVVTLRIERRYQPFIRSDSRTTMATEGLLGDRYVIIS